VAALLAGVVALLAACGGGGSSHAEPGAISFGRFDSKLDDFRIWIAKSDGSGERPLVPQVSWMSDWSPDGGRLVFEDMTTLKTIAADGSDARVVVGRLGWQAIPKWSPTGEWIAFEGSTEKPSDPADAPPDYKRSVWVVRPDGKDLHQVTNQFDIEPVFSPDGSQLAFGHVTRPGTPEQERQAVVVVKLDGTDRRQIVPPTAGLQHVDWSPDGKWITFNTEPLQGVVEQPSRRGSVFAVHPDGTGLHVLVPATPQWVFFKAVWSPDGKQLLTGCNTPSGGYDRLCVIDLKTSDVRVLIDHGAEKIPVNFPAWGSAPH